MNVQIIAAISEAIRGLKSVPSGHLYAQVMGHMTLDTYNGILGILTRAGLIEVKNHLITWTGPTLEETKGVQK